MLGVCGLALGLLWTSAATYAADEVSRVAVVGGGIGGASAAYFLKSALGDGVQITVLEAADKLGGRLSDATVSGLFVEVGGSIIHSSNRLMMQFVQETGLNQTDPQKAPVNANDKYSDPDNLGIYSAPKSQFFFETADNTLINALKIVWRYGLSFFTTRSLVADTVKHWEQIYDLQEQNKSFVDVPQLFAALQLKELTEESAHTYFKKQVSERFLNEFIDAVSLVNYGQYSDLNALADSVSLAGAALSGDLWSVLQGNGQVPTKIIEKTASNVHLNAKVSAVSKSSNSKLIVKWNEDHSEEFDAVVIAAPLLYSGIQFDAVESSSCPVREYVTTHVTFAVGKVNPAYFGRTSGLPGTIVSLSKEERPSKVPFRSLSSWGRSKSNPELSVYKLFSDEEIQIDDLKKVFSTLEQDSVRKFVHKAYPYLYPGNRVCDKGFVLDEGLFYVNAMEAVVSSMETEAIAGRNVALLTQSYLEKKRTPCDGECSI